MLSVKGAKIYHVYMQHWPRSVRQSCGGDADILVVLVLENEVVSGLIHEVMPYLDRSMILTLVFKHVFASDTEK